MVDTQRRVLASEVTLLGPSEKSEKGFIMQYNPKLSTSVVSSSKEQ